MKRPITRIVRLSEVKSCPSLRLDSSHYIPRHRKWECGHGTRLRSRGAMIKTWLDGEISSEELLEAIRLELGKGGEIKWWLSDSGEDVK